MLRQILAVAGLTASCTFADTQAKAYLISTRDIADGSFVKRIKTQKLSTIPDSVEAAKLAVQQEKRQSDSAVAASEARLVKLRERKAEILRMSDAGELLKTLERKEDGLQKIREEATQSLQSIALKGVYAVVVSDASVKMGSKRVLQERAASSLASTVIPDLRGWYLSSSTEVRNSQLMQDQILQESRGELTIEEEWLSHPLRQQEKFLYLAKVQVRPLASGNKSLRSEQVEPSLVSAVIDLSAGMADSLLRIQGLTDENLKRFRDALPASYAQDLQNERQVAIEQTCAIEENRKTQEAQIQRNILEIRQKLAGYQNQLDKQLQELGKASPTSLIAAVESALAAVDEEIRLEMARKLAAKELEPVAIWRKIVPSQGEPSEDIAHDVKGLMNQLEQSYGRVDKFLQVSESQNSMLVRDETLHWQDWSRRIDRAWVLLVPSDENDYQVSVIAYFKMEGGHNLPAPTPYRAIVPYKATKTPTLSLGTQSDSSATATSQPAKTCKACWLAGGLAVGTGVTAAILLLTQKNDNTTSTTPATNKSSVEATW